ncbi:MAG: hypothetical protein AB7J46_06275 [Candidatus Altimarinota bacterium]
MASKIYRLAKSDTAPVLGDWLPLPQLVSLLSLPMDATGQGGGAMEIRTSEAFKLIDEKAHDGSPQTVEVTITVRRMAADANEAQRITDAVEQQSRKSSAAKLRKAEESERHTATVLNAFREGSKAEAEKLVTIQQAAPKLSEQVAEAVKLVGAIGALTSPKALTGGNNQ